MKLNQLTLALFFAVAMVFVGLLRLAGHEESVLTPFAGYATPLYIAVTLFFIFMFMRLGLNFDHVGFKIPFREMHFVLAVGAVVFLQLNAWLLQPALEEMIGSSRDLSRFSDVQGSTQALLLALAASWTFAAFGEEIAFRIVMLRGIASALGNERTAIAVAIVLQAVVFGIVHLYQGPAGAVGAAISGLVFGVITVLGKWSIWPAAIAHGTNNSIGLLLLYAS